LATVQLATVIAVVLALYYWHAGRAGAGGAKSMAGAIFEAVSTFASTSPQNLKQICITVQHRGMVDEFVSVIEKAETTADHPSKSVWTRLKGLYSDCSVQLRTAYLLWQ